MFVGGVVQIIDIAGNSVFIFPVLVHGALQDEGNHGDAALAKQALLHSSRSRIIGSTASALCAGIHAAASPSASIVSTTPPNTSGSFGDA